MPLTEVSIFIDFWLGCYKVLRDVYGHDSIHNIISGLIIHSGLISFLPESNRYKEEMMIIKTEKFHLDTKNDIMTIKWGVRLINIKLNLNKTLN